MTKKDKLIERFLSLPRDFEIDELNTLMKRFGYSVSNKPSGSRMAFLKEETKAIARIHRPHPGKIINPATLKDIYDFLKEQGDI
jgi:hypothetical protein